MTKARDLANLLGGGTSGVATFGGTAAIRVPNGTTEQRPTAASGMIRFNTTTESAEVYDGNTWAEFGAPPPTIGTVSPSTYGGETGTTFTINGANFQSSAIVYFVTSGGTEYAAATTTVLSSSQITATTPQDFTVADEPLDVKVVQSSGAVTKLDAIDCGGAPTWVTSSGSIGSVSRGSSFSGSVQATDPDGGSVTYAITSGALLSGLSLNSSTGQITGTYPLSASVGGTTTATFTVTATDNVGNTSSRSFSITGNNDYLSQTFAYTGSEQTFTVPTGVSSAVMRVWGAGGAASGGAGGFSKATVSLTAGETIKIIVGQGGLHSGGRGGGGGYSGVFASSVSQANHIIVSGGGGGGSGGTEMGGSGGGGDQDGLIGGYAPAVHEARRGRPGTTTAGGAHGTNYGTGQQAGSALQGGDGINAGGQRAFGGGGAYGINDTNPGGGGGGGYFGGGGADANASGGGGSGKFNSSRVSSTSALRQPTGTQTAVGTGETGYVSGVGVGGADNTSGGNGLVFIQY